MFAAKLEAFDVTGRGGRDGARGCQLAARENGCGQDQRVHAAEVHHFQVRRQARDATPPGDREDGDFDGLRGVDGANEGTQLLLRAVDVEFAQAVADPFVQVFERSKAIDVLGARAIVAEEGEGGHSVRMRRLSWCAPKSILGHRRTFCWEFSNPFNLPLAVEVESKQIGVESTYEQNYGSKPIEFSYLVTQGGTKKAVSIFQIVSAKSTDRILPPYYQADLGVFAGVAHTTIGCHSGNTPQHISKSHYIVTVMHSGSHKKHCVCSPVYRY